MNVSLEFSYGSGFPVAGFGYNAATGQAYVSLTEMFPILPSAGMTLEF